MSTLACAGEGARSGLLCLAVRQIRPNTWLLVLLSAGLQVLTFPLPNWYLLGWVAVAPLLVALLRARQPVTLQLTEGAKLLPATPWQAFLLAYACGILWYAGTCYWIYNTMRQYGGVGTAAALGMLLLFCLYLAIYHGLFGLAISVLARRGPSQWALVLSPVAWVAVELARTRITGFPWELLGSSQVGNIPLARIATATGVYGLSFEIMVVNAAVAAAFVVRREKRQMLLLAAAAAAIVLQAGQLLPLPEALGDHSALLVQANVPILEGSDWTKEYFEGTLSDLGRVSTKDTGDDARHPGLIAWPESPAPFYATDPAFRDAVSVVARSTQAWMVVGTLGVRNAGQTPERATQIYNSASLVSPSGEWTGRYDKVHLVPFGEYVPFRRVFAFASGLTQNVGDFAAGSSRMPLEADGTKLGVFICYESVFPDEVREFAANGAQVFVNISNDGWYGDSGAYAQHLQQARMRAVENARWLLRDTNTGVTATIDPYGRVAASIPRKLRTALRASYGLSSETTFYTRHGDWFAYGCAIISLAALAAGLLRRKKLET